MSRSILFLTGSLRADSFNTRLTRIAARQLPAPFDAHFFDLAEIPPYNGDHEGDSVPAAVTALRHAVSSADGVFWSTPEYNYGLPGVVKNVIDWASRPVIPQNSLVGKPMNAVVATISATNGVRALSDLKRFWNSAGGISVPLPDCVVNLAPSRFVDDDGIDSLEPETLKMVSLGVDCLVRFIESGVSDAVQLNWRSYLKALAR